MSGGRVLSSNGKCLEIDAGDWAARKNGGKIQMWTCNGSDQQKWTPDGGRLVSSNGKCLDFDAGGYLADKNGGIIQAWDCNGQPQQQWKPR